MKEESTIGIGKENVDPNILRTDSASDAPMKVAKPKMIDVYIKMETLTDKVFTSQMNMLPSMVWEQVKTSLNDMYSGKGWDDHKKHHIIKRVCCICAKLNNGDAICTVEDIATMTHTKRLFMVLIFTLPIRKRDGSIVMQRIMGFVNPSLLGLMNPCFVDTFIDATFDCTPEPFIKHK